MGVEPGDEVIVPPYTFIATVNVVLRQHALPVFVDTDAETFQMDARKLEAAITPAPGPSSGAPGRQRLRPGCHPPDRGATQCAGARRRVPGAPRRVARPKAGHVGLAGGFSFQASKNLNSGEGGAILYNDQDLRERCYAFHNNGTGSRAARLYLSSTGCNLRMTEFQAALLVAQMTRIEAQARMRTENART